MHAVAFIDCPEHMLGNLSPGTDMSPATGAIIINGVELPQRVAEEIRRLGLALSWYNRGELEDAVQACKVDEMLIDDPDGLTFRDKLSLTAEEYYQHSHTDEIEEERRARKKRRQLFGCDDDWCDI